MGTSLKNFNGSREELRLALVDLLEERIAELDYDIARVAAKPDGYYVLSAAGDRVAKDDWLELTRAWKTRLEGRLADIT